MYIFPNNRQVIGEILIGHIQLRSDFFQKNVNGICNCKNDAIRGSNLFVTWFVTGTVEVCCLKRKAVLFAAESQLFGECLGCRKF